MRTYSTKIRRSRVWDGWYDQGEKRRVGVHTGGIVQILRTTSLKCACHLIFFSIRYSFSWRGRPRRPRKSLPQLTTLNVLHQYVLHVLFLPPNHFPDGALDSTMAPVRIPFPFVNKPNTLDRDRVVVPAGWDSWGKIVMLHDDFDVKAWASHGCVTLSSDSGIDSDTNSVGKCMRPWYRTKALKYAPSRLPRSRTLNL
jgi:hypothetical protein